MKNHSILETPEAVASRPEEEPSLRISTFLLAAIRRRRRFPDTDGFGRRRIVCAHSTTTPGRRRKALAEPIPGYSRPALRRARLVTLASARAARSSARYTRTASGWDSFQTSGRSA
jgi:hypothetical protein